MLSDPTLDESPHEVTAIHAFESGFLRVVVSARSAQRRLGVSIEVYGRSPDNCWREAVRLDCYSGDAHAHLFPLAGAPSEEPLGASADLREAVELGVSSICTRVAGLLAALGYARSATECLGAGGARAIEAASRVAEQLADGAL